MATVSELWAWVRVPMREMAEQPDGAWSREFFLERLGSYGSAEQPFVEELVRGLDELPDGDRAAVFADESRAETFVREVAERFEQPVAEAAAEPAAEVAEDIEVWNAYLVENGTQWNGDEEAWPPFREWFLYYAAERGVTDLATAFLDYAEGQPDKRAVFAQYGVMIVAGEPAEPETVVRQLRTDVVEPVLAKVMGGSPQVASLGEARLRGLVEATLAAEIGRRTGSEA